jgi:ABC-type Na+ efflux pump permease subunit
LEDHATKALRFRPHRLYLPVVALTASLLLLTSAHARSYKEAQLFLTPVLFGMIIPVLAPLLPGVQLTSAIVVVPIANISIAVRDVLTGQANWLAVGAAWVHHGRGRRMDDATLSARAARRSPHHRRQN